MNIYIYICITINQIQWYIYIHMSRLIKFRIIQWNIYSYIKKISVQSPDSIGSNAASERIPRFHVVIVETFCCLDTKVSGLDRPASRRDWSTGVLRDLDTRSPLQNEQTETIGNKCWQSDSPSRQISSRNYEPGERERGGCVGGAVW